MKRLRGPGQRGNRPSAAVMWRVAWTGDRVQPGSPEPAIVSPFCPPLISTQEAGAAGDQAEGQEASMIARGQPQKPGPGCLGVWWDGGACIVRPAGVWSPGARAGRGRRSCPTPALKTHRRGGPAGKGRGSGVQRHRAERRDSREALGPGEGGVGVTSLCRAHEQG